MLELHQFRHSAFCLKVRMALQAKGLSFREVEVTPGIGQVSLFRLSGQRQVPVLVDGDEVLLEPEGGGQELTLSRVLLIQEFRCPELRRLQVQERQRSKKIKPGKIRRGVRR